MVTIPKFSFFLTNYSVRGRNKLIINVRMGMRNRKLRLLNSMLSNGVDNADTKSKLIKLLNDENKLVRKLALHAATKLFLQGDELVEFVFTYKECDSPRNTLELITFVNKQGLKGERVWKFIRYALQCSNLDFRCAGLDYILNNMSVIGDAYDIVLSMRNDRCEEVARKAKEVINKYYHDNVPK